VKLLGDLVLAAFFSGEKRKDRETKLTVFADAVQRGEAGTYRSWLEEWRTAERPLAPFHWELEFPEVFERENPGFDAFVGNPPFLGGTRIGGQLGLTYHDFLVARFVPATGLADIIALFLRRAFALLRRDGALGIIATNTVSQGDTRSAGLAVILRLGGALYNVRRRYVWPGSAAVVVSLLHVSKGDPPQQPILDGHPVTRISAYLLAGDADDTPSALAGNKNLSYLGTKVWGSGFVFEQSPSNGSSSLEDMNVLIAADPANREVISSYLGGEELNSSPTQHPSRFVIDFGSMSEPQARRWPQLLSIVEERVRPVREKNEQRSRREEWWLHANRVEETGPYLQQHGRLLAASCVSQHLSFAFVPKGTVVQNSAVVLLLHENADFAVVQCRVHEVWARFLGSSMKDDLRYIPSDCFETFPFPEEWESRPDLETVGKAYYEFRADLMVRNNEGLTKTYNRFHDPEEDSPDIITLRELHAAMDRAVLDAYGWTDIPTDSEFLLDYEVDEDESSRKKKPWRYRWPDDVRDEVLARLLELNAQRAAQEALAGAGGAKARKAKGRHAASPETETLF